jgi:hypothetical protein
MSTLHYGVEVSVLYYAVLRFLIQIVWSKNKPKQNTTRVVAPQVMSSAVMDRRALRMTRLMNFDEYRSLNII